MLTGENGLINKSLETKIQTEIGEIEERANLIYSNKLMEKIEENLKDKPAIQEIVEQLEKEGYKIEAVAVSDIKITDISLEKERVSIGKGQTNTIRVILESLSEPYNYYVVIDSKYYKMNLNNGTVTIDRVESNISDTEDKETILMAKSEDETIATVEVDNENNTIRITSSEKTGIVRITVTYGSYVKTCEVKVCDTTEELEINSVRARIATGYTRWLLATTKPESASQEFDWSSSDTSIATVNNKGIITAKRPGKVIITVKTTDGSNLEKTCEVTIEDGVDIETLTDYQKENVVAKDENGNLIIIPGNFKVLTSEATKIEEGIVIQDEIENEFVWVPVDSVSTGTKKVADDIRLGRYEDFGIKSASGNYVPKQDAYNYKEKITILNCQELVDNGALAKDLEAFINNTRKYGGYYIARYEAGEGDDGKAVSSRKKSSWVDIYYYEAKRLSANMYNNDFVESDLINSYSWDTALIFIQKYSGITDYADRRETGIVCNISSMGCPNYEFSTETSLGTNRYVSRGGHYNNNSAKIRYTRGSDEKYNFLTFRPIIYIK